MKDHYAVFIVIGIGSQTRSDVVICHCSVYMARFRTDLGVENSTYLNTCLEIKLGTKIVSYQSVIPP